MPRGDAASHGARQLKDGHYTGMATMKFTDFCIKRSPGMAVVRR